MIVVVWAAHISGANGAKFDFHGQPNGVYTLFAAPHFVVNMRLLARGPSTRFVDQIGVRFGNWSFVFDTTQFNAAQLGARLRRSLPAGASARVTPYNVDLTLCPGTQLHIAQMYTQWHIGERFFHLDFDLVVAEW